MFLEIGGKRLEIRFTSKSFQFIGEKKGLGQDPCIKDIFVSFVDIATKFRFGDCLILLEGALLHEKEITQDWIRENIVDNPDICKKTVADVYGHMLYKAIRFMGASAEDAKKEIDRLLSGETAKKKIKNALEKKKTKTETKTEKNSD